MLTQREGERPTDRKFCDLICLSLLVTKVGIVRQKTNKDTALWPVEGIEEGKKKKVSEGKTIFKKESTIFDKTSYGEKVQRLEEVILSPPLLIYSRSTIREFSFSSFLLGGPILTYCNWKREESHYHCRGVFFFSLCI